MLIVPYNRVARYYGITITEQQLQVSLDLKHASFSRPIDNNYIGGNTFTINYLTSLKTSFK